MGKLLKSKDLEKYKHPNSRKTNALAKHAKKVMKRHQSKWEHSLLKQKIIVDKLLWFRENVNKDVHYYNAEEIIILIKKYLNRFNDEMEQIEIKNSIGKRNQRQHASRESIIKMTVKRETEEFNTSGLEIPEISNEECFSYFKNWDGENKYIQNIKLYRYRLVELEQKAVTFCRTY